MRGWRSGESARNSINVARVRFPPSVILGLSLLLVVILLREVFSGYSFLQPQKPATPNSDQYRRCARKPAWTDVVINSVEWSIGRLQFLGFFLLNKVTAKTVDIFHILVFQILRFITSLLIYS